MINIDVSVMMQIVNFLFLIWVLNLVLYRPIRNILLQRKKKMDGLEQSIETFQEDAVKKDAAFAQGIKEARAKGLKEKETLLQAAAEEERKIVDQINKKAQAELAEIRSKIEEDTQKVREALLQEVDSFANSIGQKILGRTV